MRSRLISTPVPLLMREGSHPADVWFAEVAQISMSNNAMQKKTAQQYARAIALRRDAAANTSSTSTASAD